MRSVLGCHVFNEWMGCQRLHSDCFVVEARASQGGHSRQLMVKYIVFSELVNQKSIDKLSLISMHLSWLVRISSYLSERLKFVHTAK